MDRSIPTYKKSPERGNESGHKLIELTNMTQIVEFSLTQEQYLEYLNLLRTHDIRVASAYARVVTNPDYLDRKPMTSPRVGRRARG